MRLIAAILLCATSLPALAQRADLRIPVHEFLTHPFPTWKGALLFAEIDRASGNETVHGFDSSGNRLVLDLRLPDVGRVRVRDSVTGPTGMVLAGEFWRASGERDEGLLFLDRAGLPILFRRTNPYIPLLVTKAADGRIWTFGQDAPDEWVGGFKDHDTLKCFDGEGNQIFNGAPMSTLKAGPLLPI